MLTPYPNTQIREILIEKNLVTNLDDYSNYDALSANIKTSHLTTEEVEIMTEYLYDNFKGVDWIFSSNISRVYPWYFIKLLGRLIPLALTRNYYRIKRKSYRDYLKAMALMKRDFRNLKR